MAEERRDDVTVDESTAAVQRRAHRARIVQIALGCLWILDAALQFQPRMFGSDLINQMMLPSAAGQPAPVAWSITQLSHFLRPDAGVWNFFFGALQLGIGVGMLFRRTVKPAIVAMAIWAFGVWWFGEGFGMLLTGTASPLTGAPGAVLLYPLVGLLVWPTEKATSDVAPGIASSAAATGPLGASAPLFAWSGFWALSAVLWLFPANRASGSIGSALRTEAGGQPSWYAHFESSLANSLPHQGSLCRGSWRWTSLVIAAGPLLSRRLQPLPARRSVARSSRSGYRAWPWAGSSPGWGPIRTWRLWWRCWRSPWCRRCTRRRRACPDASSFAGHPVAGATTSAMALAVLVISATYPVAAASASAASSNASGPRMPWPAWR